METCSDLPRLHCAVNMGSRRFMMLVLLLCLITGWLVIGDVAFAAIWPSIFALVLVFGTRNVLMGLLGGSLVGWILLVDGKIWLAPVNLVETHLLPNFGSTWKSGAIIFTLMLGGFVHLLERGGALQSLLVRLLHGSSRRKVETGAGIFGLVCFFDGLANSLLVGRIFKPMARESGVRAVRLAYIVDTTSAAVACLAFISTWIAYQLGMIREGFILAGLESAAEPYHLFFASIPHNYYAWFALFLMGMSIWKEWNLGPMATVSDPPIEKDEVVSPANMHGTPLWRAAAPIGLLLAIVFFGIYADGTVRMQVPLWPVTFEKVALSFAEGNVPVILILASAAGSFLAWLLWPQTTLSAGETRSGIFMEGMIQLFRPVLILVMAWMLSSTLGELGAAAYLGELLGGRIPLAVFPMVVFITGALISFTTGTSWGTMGLLMPLAIPLAISLGGGELETAMGLLPMVVGAVFSGAVFGDHCSPISDTTIVSSIACGIDPIDHVRTQLPYAILAAVSAGLLGFLGVGLVGGSPWLSIVSGIAFLLIIRALMAIYPQNAGNA